MTTTKGFYSRNRSKIKRSLRATDKTANFTIAVPANHIPKQIYIAERNNAAVTGGIRIGTAAAGTQVLVAGAVAALSNNNFPAVSIPLIPQAAYTLYVEAVTAWNGASIDVKVEFEEVAFT